MGIPRGRQGNPQDIFDTFFGGGDPFAGMGGGGMGGGGINIDLSNLFGGEAGVYPAV